MPDSIVRKLKRTSPVYYVGDEVHISSTGAVTTISDGDGAVRRLLELLDGTRTVSEVHSAIVADYPTVTLDEVADAVAQLDDAGFTENAAFSPDGLLDDNALGRWERNVNFFGSYAPLHTNKYELQHRLQHTRVTLLGLGGLGSHILYDLAAMGVLDVRLVEFDRVELSNLNRQILYGDSVLGRPKMEVAVQRIRAFNSRMRLDAVPMRIGSSDDVLSVVHDRDVVIGVADRPKMEIANWVNAACVEAGATLITGGLDTQRAVYYTVIPGVSGCLECWKSGVHRSDPTSAALLEEKRRLQIVGDNAAFCPLVTALTGALLAELVRVVTGIAPPVATGRLVEFRFDDFVAREAESWERRPGCPTCGSAAPRASRDGRAPLAAAI